MAEDRDVERVHKGPVNSIAIEGIEGRYLISSGADACIHIFDLADVSMSGSGRTCCKSIASAGKQGGHRFSVTGVNWFPFDTGLFTSSSMDCSIKVWDANTMESACTFKIDDKVYSHALSPFAANSLIAAASESPNIRLCDLRTGAFSQILAGHQAPVLTVAWSPKHEFILASGSVDQSIRLWDIRKARSCLMSLDQHNTIESNDPSLPPKKRPALATTSSSSKPGKTKPSNASSTSTTALAHTAAVNGIVFTSTGDYLLSTGRDECIRLWDIETGRNTLTNYGPYIHNKSPATVLPAITPITSTWPPLMFHPSDNRQTLVFDLFSGELVQRLKGHFGRVGCVGLHPFRQEAYTGSVDHEILCWMPSFVRESVQEESDEFHE
ncbi:DNA excision repair protein ERCC-8, partial [Blyttiomyces sp. JEL0837]